MRLLFIDFTLPQVLRDAEFPAGGWAVQLHQLLAALTDANHQAGVLTWKGANSYVGSQSVCDLLETYDPTRGIRKLRFVYSRLPSLYAAARSYRPDVVLQSCSAMETGVMALIAQALGVPFVHRIASDPDTDGRYVSYLDFRCRTGFRYGLRKADFVICQNSYQLGEIRKRYPGKAADILHNCIKIPASASVPIPRVQKTYIAWMGNFSPPKNLPLLANIAQLLPEIEFRIAGATKHVSSTEIFLAMEKLKQLENVRFVGYLKRGEILPFLTGAVALLNTSHFEGFSNTFLESLAAGTPVVLRRAVDPDAIIRTNGLGIAAHDGQQLANCVREIWTMDAARHEELSRACRRYVALNHTPSAAASRLVSLLKKVCRNS